MKQSKKEAKSIELLKEIVDEFIFTDKGNILEQVITGDKYQVQGFVRPELDAKLKLAVALIKNKKLDYDIDKVKEGRFPIKSTKLKTKKTKKLKVDKKVKTTSKAKQSKLEIVKLLRKTVKGKISRKELLQFQQDNNIKSLSFIMSGDKYKTKERGIFKVPPVKDFK